MKNSDYEDIVMSHYDKVALEDGASSSSTMKDEYVRNAETEGIVNTINAFKKGKNKKLRIVDVGCGNGYTLSILKNNFSTFEFQGIEKNNELRAITNKRLKPLNINVYFGDVLDNLVETHGRSDIVICQRVLINLLNKEDQIKSIKNVSELVKNGGIIILIECMAESLNHLNDARAEFGLSVILPSYHNLYMNYDMLPSCKNGFEPFKSLEIPKENFLSSHYYITRVLHDILLQGRPFIRNSQFVKFFSQALPKEIGDYSPLKFFVFKKIEEFPQKRGGVVPTILLLMNTISLIYSMIWLHKNHQHYLIDEVLSC